jgi:hypothetical protein
MKSLNRDIAAVWSPPIELIGILDAACAYRLMGRSIKSTLMAVVNIDDS